MNEILIAVVLGLVEGFTEFVPVSSTGHLILAGSVLGFTGEKASTFEVVIQLGAILAVVVLYRERLLGLWPTANPVGFAGARGLGLLALTTVPSLALGAVAHDYIKAHLFTPLTVIWALAVGGIAILLAELLVGRQGKPGGGESLESLTWRQAVAVGLFQCLALWPGVSRSAATIVGGRLSGLGRRTAVEYSFLAAVPVMLAATTFDLYKARAALGAGDVPLFAVGFAVSFLAAALAIKTFLRLLRTWTLSPFAWYRLGLAAVAYWLLVWL